MEIFERNNIRITIGIEFSVIIYIQFCAPKQNKRCLILCQITYFLCYAGLLYFWGEKMF